MLPGGYSTRDESGLPHLLRSGTLADREVEVPVDIFGLWPDKPAYLARTSAWMPGPDGHPVLRRRGKKTGGFETDMPGKSHAAIVRQFHECPLAIDEGVGRLVTALEESGQLADTLVVYTTDQGDAVGEHGFNSKLAPYDATIASPLIMSWPGRLPAGVEIPWPLRGREFTRLLEPGADDVAVPSEGHTRTSTTIFRAEERLVSRVLPSPGHPQAVPGLPAFPLLSRSSGGGT
jgi:hypothetical protein